VKSDRDCTPGNTCSWRLEAVVTIDGRGQMVLPKDVREKAGIGTGDRVAVISWEKDGEVCCIALMKAEPLDGLAAGLLGPFTGE
jgi:antitoxin PrlF